MKRYRNKFFWFSALVGTFLVANSVDAVGPQNSRAAVTGNIAPARMAGRDVKRTASATARPSVSASRAGAMSGVSGRTAMTTASRNANNAVTISRSASVARSARASVAPARSATNVAQSTVSRAGTSRATAVFDDVSKIGGGYAQCRESYATCMDQFCAKANDTYRRCFCSERFTEFRDAEDALDQARILLQRFEDNSLNAVDKTAAEVEAMYSATVGEAAIKNDTSAAAALLTEIGDLLSGKKKTVSSSSSSMGVMSLDFSTDLGDIWGGSATFSSVFGGGSGVDLSELEGEELFSYVHKQCSEMVASSCQSDAVANMAKSAYSIMITQDCNAYEKSVDTKRQQVQNTVRQAEKILREARLEEYRAHNSQDVNECLDKVRSAMLSDAACGSNYKRCLDYTGAYINQSTGEPIYTQRLFELQNLISLAGAPSSSMANVDTDILSQNAGFNQFLETRKMFANSALDSCRDISDVVWTEFKRAALIEIAQAQDEKVEEVKASCIDTVRECYDTQSNALKSFDASSAEAAGAISTYAARVMCQEKVTACAALYGDTDGCTFDGNGKLKSGGDSSKRCGLEALLTYVDTVDSVHIAEGCGTALENFVTDLCTPTSGSEGYPWNCRKLSENALKEQIIDRAKLYCVDTNGRKYGETGFNSVETDGIISRLMDSIQIDISNQLSDKCEEASGIWLSAGINTAEDLKYEKAFYIEAFGGVADTIVSQYKRYGVCLENDVRYACQAQDVSSGSHGWVTYDATNDACEFADDWYQYQCESILGGSWEQDICYWNGL